MLIIIGSILFAVLVTLGILYLDKVLEIPSDVPDSRPPNFGGGRDR